MLHFFRYSSLTYLTCLLCEICGVHLLGSSIGSIDTEKNILHCYCNSASCITTNYMCKSDNNGNGCFKKFDTDSQQFFYGCLNSVIKKSSCFNLSLASSLTESSQVYDCCFSAMCNNVEPEKYSTAIRLEEEEKMRQYILLKKLGKPPSNYYTNSEIWFRAFLIAVPFCGLILFLLIVQLGLRILKTETTNGSFKSSKLLKKKYAAEAINKKQAEEKSHFKSHLIPPCDNLDKKISIVFKPFEDQTYSKNGKYLNFYKDADSSNKNMEPRIHEKFSKQNSNKLHFPYKSNDAKHKNYYYKNVSTDSENYDERMSLNSNNVVTIDKNSNYLKYNLIN